MYEWFFSWVGSEVGRALQCISGSWVRCHLPLAACRLPPGRRVSQEAVRKGGGDPIKSEFGCWADYYLGRD